MEERVAQVSVLYGASFDNVVCLDIDGMSPASLRTGMIEKRAQQIGDRFHLGDCLVVLSGSHIKDDCLDWSRLNYHLIYDQRTSWYNIYRLIRKLAAEHILEDRLRSIRLSRRWFTTRMGQKTLDGFHPFPVGFVKCDYPIDLSKRDPGGIVDWLVNFKISRLIPPAR